MKARKRPDMTDFLTLSIAFIQVRNHVFKERKIDKMDVFNAAIARGLIVAVSVDEKGEMIYGIADGIKASDLLVGMKDLFDCL